jgi:CRP/FNR family transcriptional regulator, dissimilatory nitrate respiration regulator
MASDGLPPSLEAISAVRELTAGDLLFRQGDPAAAVYGVERGRLRLIRRTVDDHLVILHTARRGEFFTEATLFAEPIIAMPWPLRRRAFASIRNER